MLNLIGQVRGDYFSIECSHARQLSRVFVSACELLPPRLDRALQVAERRAVPLVERSLLEVRELVVPVVHGPGTDPDIREILTSFSSLLRIWPSVTGRFRFFPNWRRR